MSAALVYSLTGRFSRTSVTSLLAFCFLARSITTFLQDNLCPSELFELQLEWFTSSSLYPV
ncbi:MAG: hypothetical protein ABFD07_03250 [Methanobacterium sp.]